jgi:hypothetical protein
MPWTLSDWIALAITAAVLTALFGVLRYLPETLNRWTAQHMGNPAGVPQRARWILDAVAVIVGAASIIASLLAPFPPLYGAALLLAVPIWARRVHRRMGTPFIVPIENGMVDSTTIAYVLASLATLVGIIRLGPS